MTSRTSIARGDVVVLFASVEALPSREIIVSPIFPPCELDRARRFHFARNRAEFLLARGMVRHVLAAMLDVAPERLPFDAAPNQKPRLAPHTGSPVDVSIAHSGGWVACGFAAHRLIGIDIETEVRAYDVEALAARVFTANERLAFAALRPSARREAFLDAWRRKEAVLKGLGCGLGTDPATVEVFRRGDNGKIAAFDTVVAGHGRWRMHASQPADGPSVALALADATVVSS
jgi:4'-phosphopantetheinyl transferase